MKLGTLTIDENQMIATLLATSFLGPHPGRFDCRTNGQPVTRQPTAEERFEEAVQRTEEFMAILRKAAQPSAEESGFACSHCLKEFGPSDPKHTRFFCERCVAKEQSHES
jgi:hypothetical protein